MSPRNYKIIIGFLVALLIGLNVIQPMIEKRADEKFAVSVMSLIDSVQGKDEATQQAYISQFKAQHRSLALSASADASCNFWVGTYNRYMQVVYGTARYARTLSYIMFLEDMMAQHCEEYGELEEIDPILN